MDRSNNNDLLIIALMVALVGGEDDGLNEHAYHLLRRRLRNSERWDPELDEILMLLTHRGPRGERRRAETRDIALSVVEGFRRSFDGTVGERLGAIEERVGDVAGRQDHLDRRLEEQAAAAQQTNADLHEYIWAVTVGADEAARRMIRYVPVRIYVGDPVPEPSVLEGLVKAVQALGDDLGLDPADELPEQSGSWWKRLFQKTRKAATHPEVQEGFRKAKAALEIHVLDKPQAEVTGLLADATAKLIDAVNRVPGPCAIQAGPLLVVKLIDGGGTPSIVSKILAPMELKRLEENTSMLQRPADLLGWLEKLCSASHDLGGRERGVARQDGDRVLTETGEVHGAQRGGAGSDAPDSSRRWAAMAEEEAGPVVRLSQGTSQDPE